MVELWRKVACLPPLPCTLLALAVALAALEATALALPHLDPGHQVPLTTLAFLTAAALTLAATLLAIEGQARIR